MLSKAEIEAIAARAKAATEGPWLLSGGGDFYSILTAPDAYIKIISPFLSKPHANLSEFIAHARQDIPALLSDLRQARGLLRRWALLFPCINSSALPPGLQRETSAYFSQSEEKASGEGGKDG